MTTKEKDVAVSSSSLPSGMTLRDYFAAAVLQGIISNHGIYDDGGPPERWDAYTDSQAASISYAYADAMLEERNK